VNQKRESSVTCRCARPPHDKILDARGEIFFQQRRRIDCVEEEIELGDVNLDHLSADRDFFSDYDRLHRKIRVGLPSILLDTARPAQQN
jgi:hypothetical protein